MQDRRVVSGGVSAIAARERALTIGEVSRILGIPPAAHPQAQRRSELPARGAASGVACRGVSVMNVCVAVAADGSIDPRWGRADRVAVARVDDGQIVRWEEIQVSWGALHDQGSEGLHHARVVTFLREHQVQAVVAAHVGDGMRHTLAKLGLRVELGRTGDARAAVLAVAGR